MSVSKALGCDLIVLFDSAVPDRAAGEADEAASDFDHCSSAGYRRELGPCNLPPACVTSA